MKFQNLFNKLWEQDPGYFRLKQATKTILAILLIMLLTLPDSMILKVFASVAAGISMQTIVGETRIAQLYFILFAFPIYLICFMLGYFSHTSMLLSNGLLMIFGFSAIYLKRFGPRFNFAPMLAWIFTYLGIILPIAADSKWLVFLGLAFGFFIAALVNLFVFPQNKSALFYDNINKFLKEYVFTLQWLAHILIHKISHKQFLITKELHKNYLFRLTVINSEIIQNSNITHDDRILRMHNVYIKQYALAKIGSMLMEAFDNLHTHKILLNETIQSQLFSIIAIYATALSNLEIKHSKSNHQEILKILTIMEKQLTEFQNILLNCLIMRQQPIIGLINLNLGLRLIFKNIKAMEHIYAS